MKTALLLLQMLLLCCLSLPARALDIPDDCSDLEMLKTRWSEKYYEELGFSKYVALDKTLSVFTCGSKTYQFAQAMWVIENLKNSPEFNKDHGYMYKRIKQQVSSFKFLTSDEKNVCAGADDTQSQIYLFPCAFKFGSLPIVGSIVHELRHIELKDRSEHIDCGDGLFQCDKFDSNLTSSNSSSFEILYLKDILKNNQLDDSNKNLILRMLNKAYERILN